MAKTYAVLFQQDRYFLSILPPSPLCAFFKKYATNRSAQVQVKCAIILSSSFLVFHLSFCIHQTFMPCLHSLHIEMNQTQVVGARNLFPSRLEDMLRRFEFLFKEICYEDYTIKIQKKSVNCLNPRCLTQTNGWVVHADSLCVQILQPKQTLRM